MQLIKTTNINEARKQIDRLSNAKEKQKVMVLSQSDEFNRKILENKKVNALLINEDLTIRDYMKQRNSGLNEVHCKLATKNNIAIAIDINKISKKQDVEKARALARLRQNIVLCKRTKTPLAFYTDSKNTKDLQNLMLVLKASTSQAKQAVEVSFFK